MKTYEWRITKRGALTQFEVVTEFLEGPVVVARGDARFDGCVNLSVDEDDGCMLHLCGSDDYEAFSRVLSDAVAASIALASKESR